MTAMSEDEPFGPSAAQPAGAVARPRRPGGAKAADRGRLKIGDDWNAIRIIALSQSNPLKAIAEFVENSIDAHAKTVTITRGREHGEHYLSVRDDGDGVPRDEHGKPDFKYVATHICDSIKRRLKTEGAPTGLQGEFGIGLLSFWTVGEELTMISTGADQRSYQMSLSKGHSGYTVNTRRVLFAERGTELRRRTESSSGAAKYRRRQRSRASSDLLKSRLVGLEIRSGVVHRNPAVAKKGLRLPIIESKRLTNLTLGKSPAPVPLNDRILDDMASDRLRGVSPLTGHGIRHIHHEFHG
jgi:Histidine kinase-, DNA gyrase B-, and HSP90-like ATPase